MTPKAKKHPKGYAMSKDGGVRQVRWFRASVAEWDYMQELAREHDTSVSQFVGDLVKKRMSNELEYNRAQRRFMGRGTQLLKESGAYPQRDELHERDLLR